MPGMRSNNRILLALALGAVAAICAAPALAADDGSPAGQGPLEARYGLGAAADWAEREAREQRRRVRRAAGPFVPVVGDVDLGSAGAEFGAARSGHVHSGQDMFAAADTPLVAVADALVIETGSDGGQGNYVHLYDAKRELTYVYMHMIEPALVAEGARVRAGERLGGVGCTGSCWGDHLHFEVRRGRGFTAPALDPVPLLEQWRSLAEPR